MLARVFRELRALFREISSLFVRPTNETLLEHKLPTGQVIQVVQGDITAEDVDAIVNAANEGIVENGQIRLKASVRLPDHIEVYVVVPEIQVEQIAHIFSPRLANPAQVVDFEMEIGASC